MVHFCTSSESWAIYKSPVDSSASKSSFCGISCVRAMVGNQRVRIICFASALGFPSVLSFFCCSDFSVFLFVSSCWKLIIQNSWPESTNLVPFFEIDDLRQSEFCVHWIKVTAASSSCAICLLSSMPTEPLFIILIYVMYVRRGQFINPYTPRNN